MLVLTGNNIHAGGDFASRSLEVRLVAGEGNLAQRTFRHRNLMQWTVENRHRILGALAYLPGEEQRDCPGRFPEWARIAASPVLGVSGCLDAFFDPWIEAAEEDGQGRASPDIDLLLREIATLPHPTHEGASQAPSGEWFTAAELLEQVPGDVLARLKGVRVDTVEGVVGLLKRNCDVRVPSGKGGGSLLLRKARLNLQERTGRQVRTVFKVERVGERPSNSEERRRGIRDTVYKLEERKDEED